MCQTPVYILFWVGSVCLVMLLGLGAVAFVTLLERKLLGLSQVRLGPNKVTFSGVLQPVMDGVKLLVKQFMKSGLNQSVLFILSPILMLSIWLVLWALILIWSGAMLSLKYSALFLFMLLGISTYTIVLTGWATMSSFAKLGSLRGILQSLSYEVALIVVFFVPLFGLSSLSLTSNFQLGLEWVTIWSILWVLFSLMETNRAPFDLVEGESELISGFNVEMGSLMFVFLFLSEYGMIIFMMLLLNLIIFSQADFSGAVLVGVMLVIRSCYPRVRYDSMMSLMWHALLPFSLGLFYLFFMK